MNEQLRGFQKQFIRGALAPGIDVAALSLARGNGKSWLAAHFFAEIKVGEDTLSKDQREGMEALYVWRETDNFDAIVEVLR